MSESCGLMVRPANALQTPAPDFVPLTAVRVRARLADLAARVEVTQEYENHESVPIEAVYIFPLDEQSAVCAFAVVIDGRRIEGQVLPRDKAFDLYDDSIRDGHGAFLLDQERPNIFTASVGSLLPGQKALIELHYLTELPREGDRIRFTLPTTVSPRYVPEAKRNFQGMSDGDRVNPPLVAATPYQLDLTVECDFPGGLIGIDSPTHRISTRLDGSRATVSLSGADTALDRDFILLLEPKVPPELTARMVRDERRERYALIHIQPILEMRREPIRVAFLLDCSGSMGGTSILEARKALLLCLQSLESGDRFEIIQFGSTHEALFGGLRDYDDRSLKKARAYVQGTEATMGGTEILPAISDALHAAGSGASPLRVVLLTDGQVSNEDDVIELAQANRHRAQVFAFGIGAGASDHLVRGLARASGGAAEFIVPGESIEQKITRQFSRIVGGCLDRIELRWDGLSASEVTPREWPALARGERLSLIARIDDGDAGRLQLSAQRGEEQLHFVVDIPPLPADAPADAVIPTLWARRRIRELETLNPSGGSRQQRTRSTDHTAEAERQRTLETLGARFGLISAATSYVAVETRDPSVAGSTQPELRRIPTALTRGWGRDLTASVLVQTDGHLVLRAKATARHPDGSDATQSGEVSMNDLEMIAVSEIMCAAPIPQGGDRTGAREADPDFSILIGQRADGGWDLNRQLAAWRGAKLSRLRQAAREIASPERERILATWVVVASLVNRTSGVPGSWSGPIAKARRWLEGATRTVAVPGGAHSWEAWVHTILGSSS
ncbi:MAG: VWA domain-containing protein [Candidatus Eisenbacteria bacterium]|nr:VWA domain-containing protein [Candidatus Eisenbacteria bacterium]